MACGLLCIAIPTKSCWLQLETSVQAEVAFWPYEHCLCLLSNTCCLYACSSLLQLHRQQYQQHSLWR